MGIDFWTGALIVVVVTGVYTAFGGPRVVLYTDRMQMLVLLFGAIAVTVVGLVELGGWGALREPVGAGFFTLWKPISDPEFPWTGILFGAPIVAVWYWCTDQFIVQRTLSASDNSNAPGSPTPPRPSPSPGGRGRGARPMSNVPAGGAPTWC